MAGLRAVSGALAAIEAVLRRGLPAALNAEVRSVPLQGLGGGGTTTTPPGVRPTLLLAVHRVVVDDHGRNRHLQARRPGEAPRPELPLNLHLLLVARAPSAGDEASLLAAAMLCLAAEPYIDAGLLRGADPQWQADELLQIVPETLSNDELARLWDALPGDYALTAAYLVKTLRLAIEQPVSTWPAVRSRGIAVAVPDDDESHA